MSPRERWIVYPLLFFSFGLAIRDQVPEWRPRPDFNVVTCKHLIVQDAQGGPAVDIHAQPGGANAGAGIITVYTGLPKEGTAKAAAVRLSVAGSQRDGSDRYGAVQTLGPLGSSAIQLTGDRNGGTIHTYDSNGKPRPTLRLVPPRQNPPEETNHEDDPRKATVRPPSPEIEEEDSPDEDEAVSVGSELRSVG